MNITRILSLIAALLTTTPIWAQPAGRPQGGADARTFTALGYDLYLASDGAAVSLVVVAGDGLLVADPLGADFAPWLKEQLESRFPGKPVRYVVQTTHLFDRARGATQFSEAMLVGQDEFNNVLRGRHQTLPASLRTLDHNRNNRLERDETHDAPNATWIRGHDLDLDGIVTAGEFYNAVPVVREHYGTRRMLTVGERKIELVAAGETFRPELTAVLIPDARVAFVGDGPPVTSSPLTFGEYPPYDTVIWIRTLADLNADTFILGNGERLSRADLVALDHYIDDLVTAAVRGRTAGHSAAWVQQNHELSLHGAPFGPPTVAQVRSVYRTLDFKRTALFVASMQGSFEGNLSYCAAKYIVCQSGGPVAALLVGVVNSVNRRGIVADVLFTSQFVSSRDSAFDGGHLEHRLTQPSILYRFDAVTIGPARVGVVAGGSVAIRDTIGYTVVREAAAPIGGRHKVEVYTTRPSVTFGLDAEVGSPWRLGVHVPVRVSYAVTPLNDAWPGHWSVHAGIGIQINTVQRAGFKGARPASPR